MSDEYAPILEELRTLKAQGEDGFEGLVRDLLESLCARTLRIVKSGPQSGKDIMSENGGLTTGIAIEAKKFEDKTSLPLDELKSKLRDALETSPTMDVWGVALSKEMKEPDWSELVHIAAEGGVMALCLDWRSSEGALPRLAVLCAAARHVTETRLAAKVAPALDAVEAHPDFERVREELQQELNAPEIGFDLARAAAAEWLHETLETTATARRRLRSHSNIRGENCHSVSRPAIAESLNRWFQVGIAAPAVLLGDEGRGKSWAALSWLLDKAETVDGPLVLAVSARDVAAGSPLDVVSEALSRCLPRVERAVLGRRLRRWAYSGRAKFVLLVDGLNERQDFAWADMVRAFQESPWKDSVALLLSCRKGHWRSDLLELAGTTDEPFNVIEVPEFTQEERDRFIQTYGLSKNDIPQRLLKLMRVPRFAHLAVSLREKLKDTEDITTARLVLEDWRIRLQQRGAELKLDDEGLLEFVGTLGRQVANDPNFSISRTEVHRHISADSGNGLEHYAQAISEIVEGYWLKPGERPHRYVVNEDLLPYAIGLDLANVVERESDRAQIQETIAGYQEQLRGADLAVAIVRAAASISVARQKATAEAKEALVIAWLSAQNFGTADFQEFWPLVSIEPDLFIRLADQHWAAQPVMHGEGEILAKSLANASKWSQVLNQLRTALPKWAGAYSLDPLQLKHSGIPESADRQQRIARNRSDWDEVQRNYTRDISANLTRTEQRDFRGAAALSIISFIPRATLVETLLSWAVARTIEEEPLGASFEWVLRENPEDHGAFENALLTEISELQAIDTLIGRKLANALIDSLATPRTMALRQEGFESLPRQEIANRPRLGNGNIVEWTKGSAENELDEKSRAERLSQFAPDPNANLNTEDHRTVARLADELCGAQEVFDPFSVHEDSVVATLARWQPQQLSKLVQQFCQALPDGSLEVQRRSAGNLAQAMLVLEEDQRQRLFAGAMQKLQEPLPEEGRAGFALQTMAVAGMIGIAAAEQIDRLRSFLPSFSFSTKIAGFLETPATSDVEGILQDLSAGGDEKETGSWLAYLANVNLPPPSQNAHVLVDLANDPRESISDPAIETIANFSDAELGKAFVDSGWSHDQAQGRRAAVVGSYLLGRFGQHIELLQLQERVVHQALPFLVEARGCKEDEIPAVLAYLESELDPERRSRSGHAHSLSATKVWMHALRADDGSIINRLEKTLEEQGAIIGAFNMFPLFEVMRALIEIDPSAAARVWTIADASQQKSSMKIGDLDSVPFTKSDRQELAALRSKVIMRAETDQALAQFAYLALRNEHQDWLIGFIRDLVRGDAAGTIARGLTLAGFLDNTPEANAMWTDTIQALDLARWLDRVRDRALRQFELNAQAHHWFERFLHSGDAAESFAAMRLFERTFTRSSITWAHRMVREQRETLSFNVLTHLDATIDERKAALKKIDDHQKGRLFGEPVARDVEPWF